MRKINIFTGALLFLFLQLLHLPAFAHVISFGTAVTSCCALFGAGAVLKIDPSCKKTDSKLAIAASVGWWILLFGLATRKAIRVNSAITEAMQNGSKILRAIHDVPQTGILNRNMAFLTNNKKELEAWEEFDKIQSKKLRKQYINEIWRPLHDLACSDGLLLKSQHDDAAAQIDADEKTMEDYKQDVISTKIHYLQPHFGF